MSARRSYKNQVMGVDAAYSGIGTLISARAGYQPGTQAPA